MKIYLNFFSLTLLMLLYIACDPNPKIDDNEGEAITTTPTETTPSVGKDDTARTTSLYNFTIIPGPTEYAEDSSVPSTDIFLTSPRFPEAILLVNTFPFATIDKDQWKDNIIPADAAFAFQTWFAGGGERYYGLENGNIVKLYRQYIDEGDPEAETAPTPAAFELIKTVDLKNTGLEPGYFICYNEDRNSTLKLSIHFTAEGRATALRYKDQKDYIPLQFTGDDISTEGIIPNTTGQYLELYEGEENGLLALVHAGNWDYATYIRKKDSKRFKFTIDHDLSIEGDSYRTSPCFE